MASPAEPQRLRRATAEVRALALQAARELFKAQGYEATRTQDIAMRAGISQRLLFSHFGTKDELFQEAVAGPFAEFIDGYMADRRARSTSGVTNEELVDQFSRGFYELAKEYKNVLLSCVDPQAPDSGPRAEIARRLAEAVQALREVTAYEAAEPDTVFRDIDPPATHAVVAGMILSVVLLDDLLFPRGTRRPSAARLTAEISKMIMHGVTHRP